MRQLRKAPLCKEDLNLRFCLFNKDNHFAPNQNWVLLGCFNQSARSNVASINLKGGLEQNILIVINQHLTGS